MRGMTLRAIAEACNGVYYGSEDNLDKEVTDITTDIVLPTLPVIPTTLISRLLRYKSAISFNA